MTYLIFDLVILALLLFFAIRGARRGLILSLLSLVSVLVAFVGAILISNFAAKPVADWLQPSVEPHVQTAVESALPNYIDGDVLASDKLTALLNETNLPLGLNEVLTDFLQEHAVTSGVDSLTDNIVPVLASKISLALSYAALFVISFVLILLLWKLLIHAIDLVSRLPGLNGLNKLGGFLLGALWCSVLLFVAAWLLRMFGSNVIPADTIEASYLLRFFMTFNPLDYLAKL